MRNVDGKIFMLKYVEPQNQKERDMFANEIGIMRIIGGDSVTTCHEAFDFKDRYWLIMDLVEGGPLTEMLSKLQGSYSEEFCKFSLYSTLKLLCEFHR